MLGLNALIKSNDDKKTIMKMAPPPAIVTINTSGECQFFELLRVILNVYSRYLQCWCRCHYGRDSDRSRVVYLLRRPNAAFH